VAAATLEVAGWPASHPQRWLRPPQVAHHPLHQRGWLPVRIVFLKKKYIYIYINFNIFFINYCIGHFGI
jgi:hypothetical protein